MICIIALLSRQSSNSLADLMALFLRMGRVDPAKLTAC